MRKIITCPSVDSTNAVAKKLALAGEGECAVAAAEQTAGRGRLARSWQSPAGEGLWVSLLLRPQNIPAERAGGAVFVAALAMAEALCAYGPARIKWPNDLVMGGKKICGMLAEAGFREGSAIGSSSARASTFCKRVFPRSFPTRLRSISRPARASGPENFFLYFLNASSRGTPFGRNAALSPSSKASAPARRRWGRGYV